MEEQLLQFPKQFSWEPEITGSIPSFSRAIVCGMGGSGLQARLLHAADPSLPFSLHQDYGLPFIRDEEKPLIVLSSYSGETEEVLDAAREAGARNLPMAVIAAGGALLELAREKNIPCIELPKEPIEPRMAIGYAMLALLRVLGAKEAEAKLRSAGSAIDAASILSAGTALSDGLADRVPLVYASTANGAVAYFWKIAMNETAKIPAFTDVVPELCHNELSGFDVVSATEGISKNMAAVFLHDGGDHPRDEKRLTLVEELLREKGIPTLRSDLSGADRYAKVLFGVLFGVAAALALAKRYGVPDAATPLIADFKQRMRS